MASPAWQGIQARYLDGNRGGAFCRGACGCRRARNRPALADRAVPFPASAAHARPTLARAATTARPLPFPCPPPCSVSLVHVDCADLATSPVPVPLSQCRLEGSGAASVEPGVDDSDLRVRPPLNHPPDAALPARAAADCSVSLLHLDGACGPCPTGCCSPQASLARRRRRSPSSLLTAVARRQRRRLPIRARPLVDLASPLTLLWLSLRSQPPAA